MKNWKRLLVILLMATILISFLVPEKVYTLNANAAETDPNTIENMNNGQEADTGEKTTDDSKTTEINDESQSEVGAGTTSESVEPVIENNTVQKNDENETGENGGESEDLKDPMLTGENINKESEDLNDPVLTEENINKESEDLKAPVLTEESTNKEPAEEEKKEEVNNQKTASDNRYVLKSMKPLTEVKAYLILNGKSDEELKEMPLDDVLSSLVDANGNTISIPEGADSVWRYVKDELDGIEEYKRYAIGKGESIDLSTAKNILDYSLEFIIGSGNQLNPNNKRYMITVYVSEKINEEFNFELYVQPNSNERVKVDPKRKEFAITESNVTAKNGVKIPIWGYAFVVDEGNYINPYLGITSRLNVRPDITLKIFELSDYLNNKDHIEVTDAVLERDMSELNAGYRLTENGAAFAVEYYINNVQVDVVFVTFIFIGGMSELTGELFTEDNGEKIVVSNETSYSFSMNDKTPEAYTFNLKAGYSDSEEYSCSLNAISSVNGNVNDRITKAVDGYYNSLDEAKDAVDISSQLFSEDGYRAVYGGEGKTFTIFFDDEAYADKPGVFHVTIKAKADENVLRSYTDAPIIGSKDPWFRVVGAEYKDGNTVPTNIVENGKSINMDTMYGYGYQTIFINDSSVDEIVPIFEKADSEVSRVARVYVDGHEYNNGDPIKLTDIETTKMFSTIIVDKEGKEHTKNYNVSFVKVTSGPKLYVVDPKGGKKEDPVRSVFLDDYFEHKHDILIANIGDEELTGLRVELNATNVKLDDYWTVGGKGTDILAPIDPDAAALDDSTALPNIAKIRLLPDGEGDIEGTLTIFADGQEPVTIKLSGRAQNPSITTEEVLGAVKYVPYSYMITTNNMYDWNTVTFSYAGEIPAGMEFNEDTGEIYGAPLEAGNYTFTVTATYGRNDYFEPSTKEITIRVLDNENETVFKTSDDEYKIIPEEDGDNGYVGEQVSDYDFVITSFEEDEVFISEGEYGQFVKLWLNGEVLTEGVDYTKEPGSTRIVINAESLEDKTNDGRNTISAEFNVDEERGEKLKRTSQNFRVELASKEQEESQPANPEQPKQPNQNNTVESPEPEADADTDELATDTVNIITHVTGADDQPLANHKIEMHSTVKTETTDASGNASFTAMEMGPHTVYVKNEKGTTIASKNFTLKAGDSLSRNGDTITIVPGQTILMTIKVDGSKASIVSVKSAGSSFTGDTSNPQMWIILIMMSIFVLTGAIVIRKQHY